MNAAKNGWLRAMVRAMTGVVLVASTSAHSEVTAKDAWVRATVAQQKSTGAFFTLTSTTDARVVAVSSPAAKIAEIHETRARDGVMSMRAVEAIDLPAGKAVRLEPGGLHVMLMALKSPVAQGDKVPIVLTVEERGGRRSTLEVRAEARAPGAR